MTMSINGFTYNRFDGANFKTWLSVTNAYWRRISGVGIFDMPDFLWRDCYDDCESPLSALVLALESWEEDLDLDSETASTFRETLESYIEYCQK